MWEGRTDLAKQFQVDLIKIVYIYIYILNPIKTLYSSGGLELYTSVKESCCKDPWVQPHADIATWWHSTQRKAGKLCDR